MADARYHKVKHLVEVEDDILAVFTVSAEKENGLENLWIAKNASITKILVHNIFAKLISDLRQAESRMEIEDKLGRLKWSISEYDEIRILFIYEKDRTIVVLIKSNTSLSDTVGNILGYYYESEDTPKSLF